MVAINDNINHLWLTNCLLVIPFMSVLEAVEVISWRSVWYNLR